ncbi:carboxylate-amine ligase [Leucobacter massiliensis]|uniref:carboxylate-amine ligase n=1 Tax=Leucobacter massiliensis TaxID=1686285 RepID=UPI001FEC5C5B|nr:glutamate--cysteine ligase [Leucobacter massiliensis]
MTDPRSDGLRTVGVEEELLLVDGSTGAPLAASEQVRRHAEVLSPGLLDREAKLEQIESISPPCTELGEVDRVLREGRRVADESARRAGARAVALGTSPIACDGHLTPSGRYLAMADRFGITMREQLTCGLHVHVGVESAREGVGVLDRIRPWLPTLLALGGNSPFWHGTDTGYASYRYQVWGRWPSAGPTELFGSVEAYRRRVRAMLDTGVPGDHGMVYFDARLSAHVPTVEIRVPDVCMDVEHTVAIVALTRALVEAAARDWRRGLAPLGAPTAVLRLAMWAASADGLRGRLVDPRSGAEVPAEAALDALLQRTAPVLRDSGELDRVAEIVAGIVARGTGAERQRRVLREQGDLGAVVRDAIAVTHGGGSAAGSL